jgi:hypothetical protein
VWVIVIIISLSLSLLLIRFLHDRLFPNAVAMTLCSNSPSFRRPWPITHCRSAGGCRTCAKHSIYPSSPPPRFGRFVQIASGAWGKCWKISRIVSLTIDDIESTPIINMTFESGEFLHNKRLLSPTPWWNSRDDDG